MAVNGCVVRDEPVRVVTDRCEAVRPGRRRSNPSVAHGGSAV
jgi:hypothetical protein